MILQISKANELGLNIYSYLYLEKLYNNDKDLYEIINNVKLLVNNNKVIETVINPLVIDKYVIIDNMNNISITPKGKAVFLDSNTKYLDVMSYYPHSLYLSGNNYPAKISDAKCIEILSKIDTPLEDIIKAIKYAKDNDLINMKFDKFIESKYYLAILEKINDDTPINFGVFGNTFDV